MLSNPLCYCNRPPHPGEEDGWKNQPAAAGKSTRLYSAVGVENGLAYLRPGDKITFHIYSDGQNGGSVLPFAERWNQPEDLADKVQLPSHPGWFT